MGDALPYVVLKIAVFNHLRLVCQYLLLRDTDKVVVVVAGEMGRLFRTATLIGRCRRLQCISLEKSALIGKIKGVAFPRSVRRYSFSGE